MCPVHKLYCFFPAGITGDPLIDCYIATVTILTPGEDDVCVFFHVHNRLSLCLCPPPHCTMVSHGNPMVPWGALCLRYWEGGWVGEGVCANGVQNKHTKHFYVQHICTSLPPQLVPSPPLSHVQCALASYRSLRILTRGIPLCPQYPTQDQSMCVA